MDMFILLGMLLIAVGLTALALQRLYSSIPVRELRRLAKRGDQLAQMLYRPVAFGASLRVLLWSVACLGLAAGILLLVSGLPLAAGIAIAVLVLAGALIWMPSFRLTIHTAQFAAAIAPGIAFVLQRLHPTLDSVARLVNRRRTIDAHSRLYEKEDLASLLHAQKDQADNRISLEELELTHRALAFGDKRAADVVQPIGKSYVVNADDSIGPILLDQLHKSGQSSFLAYKEERTNLIGTLLMRDAVSARTGGRVLDLVRSDVCFVHEDFTLLQVLAALQKAHQHTAIVVNSFEETVGLITQEAVLAVLLGVLPGEDFSYESRSAIAAYKPPRTTEDDASEADTAPSDDQTDEPVAQDSDGPHMLATSPEPTEVIK